MDNSWKEEVMQAITKCRTEVDEQTNNIAETTIRHAEILHNFTEKLEQLSVTMDKVRQDVAATKEVVETFKNVKGFFAVLQGISATIKILLPIGIVIGGIFYFFKTGKWPPD